MFKEEKTRPNPPKPEPREEAKVDAEEKHPATRAAMAARHGHGPKPEPAEPLATTRTEQLEALIASFISFGGHRLLCPCREFYAAPCGCGWGGLEAEAKAVLG